MTRLELVVGSVWIGLLVGVLLVQALVVWRRHRWATALARKARRLARSIGEGEEETESGKAQSERTPRVRPRTTVAGTPR